MASKDYLDNSGLAYFLTKLASWIPSWFPSQSGQSGKVLTTNGSSLSWTAQAGATDMTGATASTDGTHGLVPAPLAGEQGKFLRGDGTWFDILSAIYPVGSIYIGVMATCPLATLGIGTWTLVASDLSLQGSGTNSAGTTVAAGLPNITGNISQGYRLYNSADGAFGIAPNADQGVVESGSKEQYSNGWSFDASRSSPIYGASNTVQPPAYIVNIWQRTA